MGRETRPKQSRAANGWDLRDCTRAPAHPGEVFRFDYREPAGVSQVDAARRLRISKNRMSLIEKGRRPVSVNLAVKLEALTCVSAELWAGLQMRHDLWHCIQKSKA